MRKKFLLVALLAALIGAGVELISWLGWLE